MLNVVYNSRPQTKTYDTCSTFREPPYHTRQEKRWYNLWRMFRVPPRSTSNVYLLGPQTKTYNTLVKRKNDTNYDALFVYIPCATHPFVASVVWWHTTEQHEIMLVSGICCMCSAMMFAMLCAMLYEPVLRSLAMCYVLCCMLCAICCASLHARLHAVCCVVLCGWLRAILCHIGCCMLCFGPAAGSTASPS